MKFGRFFLNLSDWLNPRFNVAHVVWSNEKIQSVTLFTFEWLTQEKRFEVNTFKIKSTETYFRDYWKQDVN